MGSHSSGPVEQLADLLNTGLDALQAQGSPVSALNSARLRRPACPALHSLSVRTPVATGRPFTTDFEERARRLRDVQTLARRFARRTDRRLLHIVPAWTLATRSLRR